MSTIRDVAKLAGVSVSTVSIIINGREKERGIPASTCERVRKAIRDLNYHPSIAARKLRNVSSGHVTIALFCPFISNALLIGRMLGGIEPQFKGICNVMLCLYDYDKLAFEQKLHRNDLFDAAIIISPSKNDIEYLQHTEFNFPIVIIYGKVDGYSSIFIDNDGIIDTVLKLAHLNGHSRLGMITGDIIFHGMEARANRLIELCASGDIILEEKFTLRTPPTIRGGYKACCQYLSMEDFPRLLFCSSDLIALGAVKAVAETGLHIPEDIQMVAIGYLDSSYTEFSNPSISVFQLPHEDIAAQAVKTLLDMINNREQTPQHILHNVSFLERDSFKVNK